MPQLAHPVQISEVEGLGIPLPSYTIEHYQTDATAALYVLSNALHPKRQFGIIPQIFFSGEVDSIRSMLAADRAMCAAAFERARTRNCYKLVFAEPLVSDTEENPFADLGFANCGKVFRLHLGERTSLEPPRLPADEWKVRGFRLSHLVSGIEIGRAFLFPLMNECALVEDVFVEERFRRGRTFFYLMDTIRELAHAHGCHDIIETSRDSRPQVHDLYRRLGYREIGREFRLDLPA